MATLITRSDYHKNTVTDEEQTYIIGTDSGKPFIGDETIILATVECSVRFNDDSLWQLIHRDDYFIFSRRLVQLSFKRAGLIDGEIEVWSEGQ